jgi:arylsulfatase A-like enzyme
MSGIGEVTDTPLANSVIKYLKGRRREPFLLVASFTNPQDITSFPGNRYAYPHPVNLESAPPLPDNFQINTDEPEFIRDIRVEGNEIGLTKNFTTEDWRSYLYHYYRLVEKVDREIGNLISALEKEGLDENTLIVFTSDHGDGAASHKLVSNLNLYQETITVPLIFTWFGVTPAGFTDRNHLVSGIDVLPTILDYAGIPIPPEISGYSLKTIIERPDSTLREFAISQLAPDPENPERLGRMITNGRYKYMLYSYGARNEQLFDLKSDPGETRNLAFNPEYSRVKNNLRSELMNWIDENRDYFRIHN